MPKKGGGGGKGKKKSTDSSRKASKSSKQNGAEEDGSVYMGNTQYNPAITEMLRSTAQGFMVKKQKCPPDNPICRGRSREPPEPKGLVRSVEILNPNDLPAPDQKTGGYQCPKSCVKKG